MKVSIVLAADDPASLARFYGALTGVDPVPGLNAQHWRVSWSSGGGLDLYAPSRRRPQARQQGRLALCLQQTRVGDDPLAQLADWIAEALARGAAVEEPERLEPFGAEAWLRDPEGNRVLLLVVP